MEGKRNNASHGTNSLNVFSLSVNGKHYSNTQDSLKFLNNIIIPYIESKRLFHDMGADQRALVIINVCTGQMTSDVLNLLSGNNVLLTNVPSNMTKYYQPLDLTVNGFAKWYMSNKFNDWYTKKLSEELDKGVPIDEISINFWLSLLKLLHAEWITNFYNHMTSSTVKNDIER
ncbi:uncharacterized protein LOC130655351 [Hydractinia symbiolongicarpus]|uniref:uncharacterized protein LOC130655351 n=1 Tax=Hydractinia symbiolongicarpus TaxID=13093 RepID=UPI00254AD1A8|nr:uncharacterized protein LOC130655351 [Hydractinia symbiolongicarpus]